VKVSVVNVKIKEKVYPVRRILVVATNAMTYPRLTLHGWGKRTCAIRGTSRPFLRVGTLIPKGEPDQPATRHPCSAQHRERKTAVLASIPHGIASFFAGPTACIDTHSLAFYSYFYSYFFRLPSGNSREGCVYLSIYLTYLAYGVVRGEPGQGRGAGSGSKPGSRKQGYREREPEVGYREREQAWKPRKGFPRVCLLLEVFRWWKARRGAADDA